MAAPGRENAQALTHESAARPGSGELPEHSSADDLEAQASTTEGTARRRLSSAIRRPKTYPSTKTTAVTANTSMYVRRFVRNSSATELTLDLRRGWYFCCVRDIGGFLCLRRPRWNTLARPSAQGRRRRRR